MEGRFLERLNRFAALIEVAGQEVLCHVANSGRMRELLVPGYRVLLKPHPGKHRKTHFDLALVDLGSNLSSADARLPNALVAESAYWAIKLTTSTRLRSPRTVTARR